MEHVSIVIAAEYRFGMETYSKSTCMRFSVLGAVYTETRKTPRHTI